MAPRVRRRIVAREKRALLCLVVCGWMSRSSVNKSTFLYILCARLCRLVVTVSDIDGSQ